MPVSSAAEPSRSAPAASGRWAAAVLALLLAVGIGAAPVRAQDGDAGTGDPLSLEPQEPAETVQQPGEGGTGTTGETGDGAGDARGDRSAAGDPETAGDGIEVAPLGDLDPATIGVLDPGGRGLGAAIWDGTTRRTAGALLTRIPAELENPVLRELARRLLLSSTAPPERARSAGEGDAPELLTTRAERLWALGDTGALLRLLDVVPREHRSPELARLRVRALFLRHEHGTACERVRDGVGAHDGAFWQRALAVCQHRAGAPQQADLTMQLLREQRGGETDPFAALYDAVTAGGEGEPPLPERPGALALALLAATDTPVPEGLLDTAAPGVLAAVAEAPETPLPRRARAAERAAARGALARERLGAIYDAFSFESERLNTAASLAEEDAVKAMTPTRRRALYHQAARDEPEEAVQAELVRQAMETAEPPLYPVLARLFVPVAAAMEPRAELAWFTPTAARLLHVAGQSEAAGAWLQMAQGEAIVDPEAKAAVTALVPYARFAGAARVPANGGLAAWRSATGAEGATLAYRESLLRASFQALGMADGGRAWVEIAAGDSSASRPAPPAASLYALRAAGRAGRAGEVVVLTLRVLGESGLASVHPVALGTALAALEGVEMTATARRIAIEAAAANGI